MILSVKPPYEKTSSILKLISSISTRIGEVNANFLNKPSPQLRKQNKIKTIHSSLRIEGNSLTEEQVTAIIDNKKVIGPKKDVIEVINAIKVYDNLSKFKAYSDKSFLAAHKMLMTGLLEGAGKYRSKGVGIVKGSKVVHLAPPAGNLIVLMKALFEYIKKGDDIPLIKSCVFHYEIAFIHPFLDGNGRIGRLWQTVILMNEYPVFEFLPFESLISNNQQKYYQALAESDKTGNSTNFIEYMLQVIDVALKELLQYNNRPFKVADRLTYFLNQNKSEFTRKDYMNVFKDISSATASRDLEKGIKLKLIKKLGNMNQSKYKIR